MIYIIKYYIYIYPNLSINAKFCVTCKLMKSENQRQVRLLVRTPHIDSGLWFKVVTINLLKHVLLLYQILTKALVQLLELFSQALI